MCLSCRDLYLLPVMKRNVAKLAAMCDSARWHDATPLLAAMVDQRLVRLWNGLVNRSCVDVSFAPVQPLGLGALMDRSVVGCCPGLLGTILIDHHLFPPARSACGTTPARYTWTRTC
jgi:hypothetical protein